MKTMLSGRRLVGLGHKPSNKTIDIDLAKYREFLDSKYRSRVYANSVFNYTIKYYDAYGNPSLIQTVNPNIRHNVLKSMVALSKFKGEYLEFHNKIKQYGIKWVSQDSFSSFLKIFNNNHDSLVQWYKDAVKILKPHEQLWIKY